MKPYLNEYQIQTFLLFALTGFAGAVLYDMGSLLLRTKSFLIRCIFDLFLSSVTVLLLLIAVYKSLENSLRFYMFSAFMIGAGCYGFIVRRTIEKALNQLFEKRKSADSSE